MMILTLLAVAFVHVVPAHADDQKLLAAFKRDYCKFWFNEKDQCDSAESFSDLQQRAEVGSGQCNQVAVEAKGPKALAYETCSGRWTQRQAHVRAFYSGAQAAACTPAGAAPTSPSGGASAR